MKTIKHIAIIAFAVTAFVALCSAGYYISSVDKLEQIIPTNINSKELPKNQNEAFKEGEILSYR